MWIGVGLAAAAWVTMQRYTPAPADVDPVPMRTTCSAEANADIDRGTGFLLQLAGPDARGAFARAAETDPDCPMAYWGQALARLPLAGEPVTLTALDAAQPLVARARAIKALTAVEQGLVDAVTWLLTPAGGASLGARLDAYENGLAQLARTHRGFDALHVLHARAALLRSTLPGDAAQTRAVAIIEQGFGDRVLSPGAAVVLLEALDPIASPALARRAADRLASAPLPAPQHLVLRTRSALGDWDAAARAGVAAIGYAGLVSAPALVYGGRQEHAVDWLIDAWLQQGQRAAAQALLARAATELERTADHADPTPATRIGLARAAARVALDERDAAALASAAPGEANARASETAWPLIFARGLVAGWRAWPGGSPERLATARTAVDALDRAAAAGAETAAPDPEIALARALVETAMAASQDEHPLVTLLLAHAADLEVRLEQTGRLSLPLLSTHGFAAAIWQRFYRYPDAEREARAELERHPNRWRAWLTRARAAAALGKHDEAQAAFRQVLVIRASADAGDAAVDEARRALERPAAPRGAPAPRLNQRGAQ